MVAGLARRVNSLETPDETAGRPRAAMGAMGAPGRHHLYSYANVDVVKTVQMTLDEELVAEVDRAAAAKGKSRSAFARDALRAALESDRERELERQHRLGYERQPVEPGEFDDWEAEQIWPK